MPTFREDLHLGHDIATIDTDDIVNKAITEEKMANDSISTRTLQDRCVTEPKLADDAVSTRTVQNKAITEPKLADDSVSTRTLQNGAVTEPKMANDSVSTRTMQEKSVTEPKIADNSISNRTIQRLAVSEAKMADDSVSTRTIQNKNVTEPKMADGSVSNRTILPGAVHGNNIKAGEVDNTHLADDAVRKQNIKDGEVPASKLGNDVQRKIVMPLTNSLDQKFTNITNELYSMIASLQVGGIALSQQFGDRTDIGISQKTLTKALGKFWEVIESITGEDYMNFTLSVEPSVTFSDAPAVITITADCSEAVGDFDNIKIYVDDVLIGESSDQEVFTITHEINKTSEIKAVGVIIGKTITKTATAVKELPFFMGSGNVYTDVMNVDCLKHIDGTLEGDYDLEVKNADEKMFIIVPISKKEEFRRCTLDMNGFEIPMTVTEMTDYIVCESKNRYKAGTYNIDININS